MAKSADPAKVLRRNRAAALRTSDEVGQKRLLKVLKRSADDLNRRLAQATGLGGAGANSFTAEQLRISLIQVADVIATMNKSMAEVILGTGRIATDQAVHGELAYMRAAERKYRGINARLPIREASMLDRVRNGTESSILHRISTDPEHPGRRGVLDRYGDATIVKFEETLQQRFLARQPWAEVRVALTAESPFLQGAPAYWAERIVRTETMHAYNRAGWETTRAVNDTLGDVVKILCATFDNRTAADSYAVHGQIRRPAEAFESWFGKYQHPPNRPNDREVVVSHRISWPIPNELKPKTDGEIASAWAREGRTGGIPARPLMTTVDLALFGVEPPPPVRQPEKP